MRLTLDVPIDVKIEENGETKETLRVTLRYPTKEEEKQFKSFEKEIKELFKKLNKFEKDLQKIDKKIEYAEKRGDYEKAEKLLDEREKVENRLEKLANDFEAKGGENYPEEMAKKSFDLLVGGADKDRLRHYAEMVGYIKIMNLLREERDKLEKKQSGE